jgi:hypothetical protein
MPESTPVRQPYARVNYIPVRNKIWPLDSIPAFSDIVESEVRQINQEAIVIIKNVAACPFFHTKYLPTILSAAYSKFSFSVMKNQLRN